jgi:hypothetical protein
MRYRTDHTLFSDEIALVTWSTVDPESDGAEMRFGSSWSPDNVDRMSPKQKLLVMVSHLMDSRARGRERQVEIVKDIIEWYIDSVGEVKQDVPMG